MVLLLINLYTDFQSGGLSLPDETDARAPPELQQWVTRHWDTNGNHTSEKVTAHWFRAFMTYELSVAGCNPVVIAAIRGDRAAKIQDFYTMQVLGFEKIREEYLEAAPQFCL